MTPIYGVASRLIGNKHPLEIVLTGAQAYTGLPSFYAKIAKDTVEDDKELLFTYISRDIVSIISRLYSHHLLVVIKNVGVSQSSAYAGLNDVYVFSEFNINNRNLSVTITLDEDEKAVPIETFPVVALRPVLEALSFTPNTLYLALKSISQNGNICVLDEKNISDLLIPMRDNLTVDSALSLIDSDGRNPILLTLSGMAVRKILTKKLLAGKKEEVSNVEDAIQTAVTSLLGRIPAYVTEEINKELAEDILEISPAKETEHIVNDLEKFLEEKGRSVDFQKGDLNNINELVNGLRKYFSGYYDSLDSGQPDWLIPDLESKSLSKAINFSSVKPTYEYDDGHWIPFSPSSPVTGSVYLKTERISQSGVKPGDYYIFEYDSPEGGKYLAQERGSGNKDLDVFIRSGMKSDISVSTLYDLIRSIQVIQNKLKAKQSRGRDLSKSEIYVVQNNIKFDGGLISIDFHNGGEHVKSVIDTPNSSFLDSHLGKLSNIQNLLAPEEEGSRIRDVSPEFKRRLQRLPAITHYKTGPVIKQEKDTQIEIPRSVTKYKSDSISMIFPIRSTLRSALIKCFPKDGLSIADQIQSYIKSAAQSKSIESVLPVDTIKQMFETVLKDINAPIGIDNQGKHETDEYTQTEFYTKSAFLVDAISKSEKNLSDVKRPEVMRLKVQSLINSLEKESRDLDSLINKRIDMLKKLGKEIPQDVDSYIQGIRRKIDSFISTLNEINGYLSVGPSVSGYDPVIHISFPKSSVEKDTIHKLGERLSNILNAATENKERTEDVPKTFNSKNVMSFLDKIGVTILDAKHHPIGKDWHRVLKEKEKGPAGRYKVPSSVREFVFKDLIGQAQNRIRSQSKTIKGMDPNLLTKESRIQTTLEKSYQDQLIFDIINVLTLITNYFNKKYSIDRGKYDSLEDALNDYIKDKRDVYHFADIKEILKDIKSTKEYFEQLSGYKISIDPTVGNTEFFQSTLGKALVGLDVSSFILDSILEGHLPIKVDIKSGETLNTNELSVLKSLTSKFEDNKETSALKISLRRSINRAYDSVFRGRTKSEKPIEYYNIIRELRDLGRKIKSSFPKSHVVDGKTEVRDKPASLSRYWDELKSCASRNEALIQKYIDLVDSFGTDSKIKDIWDDLEKQAYEKVQRVSRMIQVSEGISKKRYQNIDINIERLYQVVEFDEFLNRTTKASKPGSLMLSLNAPSKLNEGEEDTSLHPVEELSPEYGESIKNDIRNELVNHFLNEIEIYEDKVTTSINKIIYSSKDINDPSWQKYISGLKEFGDLVHFHSGSLFHEGDKEPSWVQDFYISYKKNISDNKLADSSLKSDALELIHYWFSYISLSISKSEDPITVFGSGHNTEYTQEVSDIISNLGFSSSDLNKIKAIRGLAIDNLLKNWLSPRISELKQEARSLEDGKEKEVNLVEQDYLTGFHDTIMKDQFVDALDRFIQITTKTPDEGVASALDVNNFTKSLINLAEFADVSEINVPTILLDLPNNRKMATSLLKVLSYLSKSVVDAQKLLVIHPEIANKELFSAIRSVLELAYDEAYEIDNNIHNLIPHADIIFLERILNKLNAFKIPQIPLKKSVVKETKLEEFENSKEFKEFVILNYYSQIAPAVFTDISNKSLARLPKVSLDKDRIVSLANEIEVDEPEFMSIRENENLAVDCVFPSDFKLKDSLTFNSKLEIFNSILRLDPQGIPNLDQLKDVIGFLTKKTVSKYTWSLVDRPQQGLMDLRYLGSIIKTVKSWNSGDHHEKEVKDFMDYIWSWLPLFNNYDEINNSLKLLSSLQHFHIEYNDFKPNLKLFKILIGPRRPIQNKAYDLQTIINVNFA